ncbi:hypothetical protein BGZ63DRAFT_380224 [Mariannaea sp. PMI_226]|nr:hypothetical protein BGZ63DRAFT_380224 [Mariannaea sp. PMI_226]
MMVFISRAIRTSPSRYVLTGRRLVSRVAVTTAHTSGTSLTEEIYKPLQRFPQGGSEWTALIESGRLWEDHFQPADSLRQGYFRAQQENAAILRDIEVLKASMKTPISAISKDYAPACAYQSVQLGGNRLTEDEAVVVSGHVNSSLDAVDLAAVDSRDLKYCLPSVPFPHDAMPDTDTAHATEFRNHLLASRWIAEASSQQRCWRTPGLGEVEVRSLTTLLMRDLESKNNSPRRSSRHRRSEVVSSPKAKLGAVYRQTTQVEGGNSKRNNKGYPKRIFFPHHLEVPSCMDRFFQWRETVHTEKKLHPLLVACQTVAYFLHIRPFPVANGRVSRMLLQDYLLRQGYCPPVLHPLDTDDYSRMIGDAIDGRPDELVALVVANQLGMMKTLKMQETMDLRGVDEMDDGNSVLPRPD